MTHRKTHPRPAKMEIASRLPTLPPSMLLRLNCIDAVAINSEVRVDHFPASIGRGTEADITINDIWASRVHCHIRCENGLLMVKDLGSRNGTRVNGVPIDESPLRHGD